LQKKNLEKQIQESDIWNDKIKAKSIQIQLNNINKISEKITILTNLIQEIDLLIQLLETDKDESLEKELFNKYNDLIQIIDKEEFNLMFSGKYDNLNAIVTIHSGAGGTESCDWVSMLLRMYLMWAERKKFKTNITDLMPGDEAGIKDVTFEVIGDFAYGNLRSEKGIHRLVRISPFDANKRRHTSFASVEVIPEIEEDLEIEINNDDLRIDTYRASGAGGQYVNKTESAIRITHIPTNIVVACQSERSQIKNREIAFKILKAKLFALYEEKRKKNMEQIAGEKKSIGWGNQIRSYVLHPYKMIKDLRTGVEKNDTDKILNGDIDDFIKEYLKHEAEKNVIS